MPRYATNTSVSTDRSRQEIERAYLTGAMPPLLPAPTEP